MRSCPPIWKSCRQNHWRSSANVPLFPANVSVPNPALAIVTVVPLTMVRFALSTGGPRLFFLRRLAVLDVCRSRFAAVQKKSGAVYEDRGAAR
jgi:hypothetical protein